MLLHVADSCSSTQLTQSTSVGVSVLRYQAGAVAWFVRLVAEQMHALVAAYCCCDRCTRQCTSRTAKALRSLDFLCRVALKALWVGLVWRANMQQQQRRMLGLCVLQQSQQQQQCCCRGCGLFVLDVGVMICGRVVADHGSACRCGTVMCSMMAQLSWKQRSICHVGGLNVL
jgi:hypothetical protein